MVVPGDCGATRLADSVTFDTAPARHACSALLTLMRVPVVVMPVRAAADAPVVIRVLFNVAVDSGQEVSNSAAAPATCGVAIEVPLM